MIIYKDIVSGDEMLSDAYDIKEIEGVLYEVDCKMIVIKKGADVDIGANASAEEAAEELEDGSETVNNIVYSFRLEQSTFDKKSYLKSLKEYMKAIKARLQGEGKSPAEVKEFEDAALKVGKNIATNFKNFDFYLGESMNFEGMVALLNYREDGITPYLSFWKHGLYEEKV